MSASPTADKRAQESNPSSALGLSNPVRDKAKLGDAQYGVTPPREKIRSPQNAGTTASCSECNAELDEAHPYRADGEEYLYHFCDVGCHERWRSKQSTQDDPRMPKL